MSASKKITELAGCLTPPHWQALRRLAASTALQEFPLDLSVYRDLIRLELIVDSGRQLRLSPLGEELLLLYSDRPVELDH